MGCIDKQNLLDHTLGPSGHLETRKNWTTDPYLRPLPIAGGSEPERFYRRQITRRKGTKSTRSLIFDHVFCPK